MAAPLLLDPATARRIAALDPGLSVLPDALPRPSSRARHELHDARWRPGDGCDLVYRVRSPGYPATFVAVTVTGSQWARHDIQDDPVLRGIRVAADPAAVCDLLRPVVGQPIRRCVVEPVRYRPGSRCVLRYDLDTPRQRLTFYAKVFAPEAFDGHAARADALGRSQLGSALCARLAAVWPQAQGLVWPEVPGRSVASVLEDAAVPSVQRARLAHRLGELLGTLHQVSDVVAPVRTPSDLLADLRSSMAAAAFVDAALGTRLEALWHRLADILPATGKQVLAHGGFRAGQACVRPGGRLLLLDLDGLCRADPGQDLGPALAHLVWQRMRSPEQRVPLRASEGALVSGYQSRAGADGVDLLDWWRAAGLLQVATRRYRRFESTDWRAVPGLIDAAAQLLEDAESRTRGRADTDLLDLDQMSALLRVALDGRADDPRQVRVDAAETIAVAHGRRMVVRYAVRGVDGPEPADVIGKAFAEPIRARLLHDHLCLLHGGPFGTDDLGVPEPLGMVPAVRLVLYRHCNGEPLLLVTDRARLREGVRGAARWLARLHTCGLSLPRTLSLAQEEQSTRSWAALVGRIHPGLAVRARLLASEWPAGTESTATGPGVPIHKDFHPGHVLLCDRLYVVDLDEARQGDPAFDVAHFCTYLEATAGHSPSLADAFLEEYAATTGWEDRGSYRSYSAYAWLKIAKQRLVGSGPFPAASPQERLVEAERAVAEGERCLNR